MKPHHRPILQGRFHSTPAYLLCALGALLCILSVQKVQGQTLQVTPLGTQDPAVLVQSLLGSGVSYSNVTYQGVSISSGTFTGGNGIVGFDSGIILSDGNAASVAGPNTTTTSTCNSIPGDPDLAALPGVGGTGTYDATVLSFDFIPIANTVSFQYVFASDEYNTFIGSYDDVFGFFVNGVNQALIPGTSTDVSINTVNNCVNPAYYIDNSNGTSSGACTITKPTANLNTTMRGLTTVLSVLAAVTPGVVNHIKMAISDVGDCSLDSNVFIRSNSFISGPTPTPTPPGALCDESVFVSRNVFAPKTDSPLLFIKSNLCTPGPYAVKIYNSAGEFIRTLRDNKTQATGTDMVYWDGKNFLGDTVTSGIYIIYVTEPIMVHETKILVLDQ